MEGQQRQIGEEWREEKEEHAVSSTQDWSPGEDYYDPSPAKDSVVVRSRDKSGLSPMEKQYAKLPADVERRVHILGTGAIGMLVAHSLRSLPEPPPVTLLFHRYALFQAWQRSEKTITVHRDDFDIVQDGFDVEVLPETTRAHGRVQPARTDHDPGFLAAQSSEPIANLVVAVKAQLTVPSLLGIRHRLGPSSTICLLQNGLGVVDELNEKVFPDPATRPSYIQGVLTHGANIPKAVAAVNRFYVVHAGLGTISLGIMPRDLPPQSPSDIARSTLESDERERRRFTQSARYLLRTLTRSPVLVAVGFAPTDLFLLQLEKLATNCIINTLTVLLDARNGVLAEHFHLKRTIRLMLAEISLVIRSLPELQGLANVQTRFSAQRLESVVMKTARITARNISSTLADVRAGKQTEIEYINGYVVKRGEELGIKCVINYAMMQLVMGKADMIRNELADQVPLRKGITNPD